MEQVKASIQTAQSSPHSLAIDRQSVSFGHGGDAKGTCSIGLYFHFSLGHALRVAMHVSKHPFSTIENTCLATVFAWPCQPGDEVSTWKD